MKKNFIASMLLFLLFSIFLIPKNTFALAKKVVLYDYKYGVKGEYNKTDDQYITLNDVSKMRIYFNNKIEADIFYNYSSVVNVCTLDSFASLVNETLYAYPSTYNITGYTGSNHSSGGIYCYDMNSSSNIKSTSNFDEPFIEFTFEKAFTFTYFSVKEFNLLSNGQVVNNQPIIDGQTEIKNDINNMENNIKENNDKNTDKIIEENNKNFNDCRESNNLLPTNVETISKNGITITRQDDGSYILNGTCTNNDFFDLYNGSNITLLPGSYIGSPGYKIPFYIRYNNSDYKQIGFGGSSTGTFNITSNFTFNRVYLYIGEGKTYNNVLLKFQLNKGTTLHPFEQYGKDVCKNRLDSIVDNENKNHAEAEESRKNIFQSILDLPGKLLDMLKSLFIPDDDFFKNKFNTLLDSITSKLGFLGYPFVLVADTLDFFLTIEDTGSYVISWPDVKVPNFEQHVIIKSGSFDLATLLDNQAILYAHNLYFVFINALLILSFCKLCNNVYARIFGGEEDTTDYITTTTYVDDYFDSDGVLTGSRIRRRSSHKESTGGA